MIKELITGALGFVTLPLVGLVIWGAVEIIKLVAAFVGGFGLNPVHYWSGFFLIFAVALAGGCIFAFLEA